MKCALWFFRVNCAIVLRAPRIPARSRKQSAHSEDRLLLVGAYVMSWQGAKQLIIAIGRFATS